ncbi:MAG: hypothetical protein KJ990_12595 [Proteobacteria bacterium]|nr:hypothetical protein [Pseudomonadota bacterium]MBU1648223.1 hypothetical protein [Pseudomonadota bacterium]
MAPQTTNPADLLDNAAAMVHFLAECAPCFAVGSQNIGLSDEGSFGLILILRDIEGTLKEVSNLL